jgi:hypothetical protein
MEWNVPASRNRRSFERPTRRDQERARNEDFECANCGMHVSCDPLLSGVQNRNHCPYCLYSRHVDNRVAGDRQAACKATMRPVGLTIKRSRNKYASERDGELMLIHRCTRCNKLVINRIAADDNTDLLLEVFQQSQADAEAFQAELAPMEITLLTAADEALVRRRLFGTP